MQWWGAAENSPGDEKLDDPSVRMWIVEHEGRPFAYAQDYDVHDGTDHHFAYLPAGARGIDQYIGEGDMLDRGHGSAFVRQHAAMVFDEGAPVVGTDPHPDNHRAQAAYRKAGFTLARGPLDTAWGRAVLMEAWPS